MKTLKTTIALCAILLATLANAQGVWTPKANISLMGMREGAVTWSIGTKGYVCGGSFGSYPNDLWEYDPTLDTWTQMANFPAPGRSLAAGFVIGTKGYMGTGNSIVGGNHNTNDFFEWDQTNNTWAVKASFPNSPWGAVGFSVGTKGYMGTGTSGTNASSVEFYEYTPSSDSWAPIANFGGGLRAEATAFNIGSKGYVATGFDGSSSLKKDLWEYDPAFGTWTQKANFGGTPRHQCASFVAGGMGFVGLGQNTQDFWEYDPTLDSWTQIANFGGTGRNRSRGFGIGNFGYVGTGSDGTITATDFWQWGPGSTVGINESVSDTEILLSPNPTSAEFQVLNLKLKVQQVKLYNVIGKLVFQTEINFQQSTIDIHQLPPGIYFVELKTENGFVNRKIVKE